MPDSKPIRSGPTPWDCALRYLGVRSHSQHELEQKLTRRGFTPEEIQLTIDRLDQSGLLNDEQFARDLTRSLLEGRSFSLAQVARELNKRGLSSEIVETVLADIPADSDYGRAVGLAEKKMGQLSGHPQDVRRRRTLAYLGRRGFSSGVCYAVIREVEQNMESDDDYR